MIRQQKGFTLIESLVVLSIVLIIASISTFLLKPQFGSLERHQFISQLQADLLYAQQYAISHHTELNVHINPKENVYYIYEKRSINSLIEREIPEMITIQEGVMRLFFQFKADGNISKFGSFIIKSGKETYKFTFLIGKGRFYVEKV